MDTFRVRWYVSTRRGFNGSAASACLMTLHLKCFLLFEEMTFHCEMTPLKGVQYSTVHSNVLLHLGVHAITGKDPTD